MPYADPEKNKAAAKQRGRSWYLKNKARHIAWQKRYNAEHKERISEYQKEWVKADRLKYPEKWELREFKQTLRGHGTTLEWYEAKFKEQNGVCAICGRPETSKNVVKGRTMRLAVDHAHHGKKQNRGLLCGTCNGALARLEVVEGWAEKAIAYLKQYE